MQFIDWLSINESLDKIQVQILISDFTFELCFVLLSHLIFNQIVNWIQAPHIVNKDLVGVELIPVFFIFCSWRRSTEQWVSQLICLMNLRSMALVILLILKVVLQASECLVWSQLNIILLNQAFGLKLGKNLWILIPRLVDLSYQALWLSYILVLKRFQNFYDSLLGSWVILGTLKWMQCVWYL